MTQTATLDRQAAIDAKPAQPQYEHTEQDKKRIKQIARAWQAYEGTLTPPLQKTPEGLDPNVMSNRCVGVVDGGIHFLFGKEVQINAGAKAPMEAQECLDSVWGEKESRIPLLQEWGVNGAVAGTAYLRVVPDNAGTIRVITVDPATVCVQTAPQDCKTVLLYCIEYAQQEKINNKPEMVYYREEIARIDPDGNARRGMPDKDDTWQIQHWTRVGNKGDWTPAGEPIAWPYPFAPIFANQNLPRPNDFYGRPDITPDIIGMNEALNVTQSCINLDLILLGNAILYASGTGESVIERQPGKIIQFENTDAKIVAVPIPSDVANGLAFAADIRSDIDEQSHVPGVATGRMKDMPRGNLSGVAIELLYQPLLSKTETKRCLYGAAMLAVSAAILTLSGIDDEETMTLAWENPLPKADLPSVQAAIALEDVGVSKVTRLRELGYDPEEEAELRQSELEQKLVKSVEPIPTLPPAIPGTKPLPGQQFPKPAPAAGAAATPTPANEQEGQQPA